MGVIADDSTEGARVWEKILGDSLVYDEDVGGIGKLVCWFEVSTFQKRDFDGLEKVAIDRVESSEVLIGLIGLVVSPERAAVALVASPLTPLGE